MARGGQFQVRARSGIPEVPDCGVFTASTWLTPIWLRSKASAEARHVQAPDAGPSVAGELHRPLPVRLQVGHPAPQGQRVVLADRLHVPHLEAGAFELGDGGADRRQFAVGEHVGVDELVDLVRRLVPLGAAGDLVVEEPSAGLEQGVQVPGVLQVAVGADVFGHADGGDGVEGAVGDVAVVLHPDLDTVGQALVGDALAGVGGLLLGQGDADDAHPVLAGRVDRHGAPAAADVQEALTGGQGQLAADQFQLVVLGLFEGALGFGGRPVGAGVHHGRAEDQFVEVVADVVVVADGAPVGAAGVQVAGAADLLHGRGGRQGRSGEPEQAADRGAHLGVAQRPGERGRVLAALPDQSGEPAEGGVEVALHVQVARHPGAGQAQFAGLEQQAAQGPAVAYDQRRGVGRTRLRAVPGVDAERERCSQQLFEQALQPRRGVSHGAHLRDERSRMSVTT